MLGIGKQLLIVLYLYIGVLLSNEKERTTDTYNETAKSTKLYVEPRKSETIFRNRQSEQVLPMRGRNWLKVAWYNSLGWWNFILWLRWCMFSYIHWSKFIKPYTQDLCISVCKFHRGCWEGKGCGRKIIPNCKWNCLCVTIDGNLEAIENPE